MAILPQVSYSTARGTDMVSLQEQIPKGAKLIRRPSRDEREDECPQLVDDTGRVLAIVEEIPADSMH
jgi:hypothetical protein